MDKIMDNIEKTYEDMKDIPLKLAELETNTIDLIEQKVTEQIDEQLNDHINHLYKIIAYQQRFIEDLDNKQRNKNVVFLGVGENTDDLGSTNEEKVNTIIEKAGLDNDAVGNITVKRLGKEREAGAPPRPILVTVNNNTVQRQILGNAKNLKDVAECSKIFIKRDIYPPTRKEWDRLRKREREEKAKPENNSANIVLDWKKRTLTRNGLTIDRFSPSF